MFPFIYVSDFICIIYTTVDAVIWNSVGAVPHPRNSDGYIILVLYLNMV